MPSQRTVLPQCMLSVSSSRDVAQWSELADGLSHAMYLLFDSMQQ